MLRHFIFALVAISSTTAASIPDGLKTADMDHLLKQKSIFEMLMYVNSPIMPDTECYKIGQQYNIAQNIDNYQNRDLVLEFLDYARTGLLKKDAVFTYYKPSHNYEMMLLYRLLYFSKDFATFYKTACWARQWMNSHLFTNALTTAIMYRDDTQYIRLPTINEIYPYIYFNSKEIREAQRIVMTHGINEIDHQIGMSLIDDMSESMGNQRTYYVRSTQPNNTCGWECDNYRLSYFMNDVDLNSYYYYCRMMMPFWVNSKEHQLPKEWRGELYFYIHQQLMARYSLERISNRLTEMEDFTWDRMNLPGFHTNIMYPNGVAVPKRDWWYMVPMYKLKYLDMLKNMEYRIMNAIDSGYVIDEMGKKVSIMTEEGLNILGNIVEGNRDSINLKYYGSYDATVRKIMGNDMDTMDKNEYIPSALQLFGSSMKDPAFYRIYEKIMQFYWRYKSLMKSYTKTELEFTGVKIEDIQVDNLMTYWEKKSYLINNAVDIPTMKQGLSFNIKTWQYQLNHKPFTYKINVNSDKTTKAVIRIFLGPAIGGMKDEEYSYLLKNFKYFFMMDEFEVSLTQGMNTINRRSIDSVLFKREYMTSDQFYKMILNSMQGKEPITLNNRQWGFPAHLLLPKGSPGGMKFNLLCYIGPLETSRIIDLPMLGKRMWYGKSLGFPLDRPMLPWFTQLNNIYMKNVAIYNEDDHMMMSGYGSSSMMNYKDMMMDMRDWSMMDVNDHDMWMGMNDHDSTRMEMKNYDSMNDMKIMKDLSGVNIMDKNTLRVEDTDRMNTMWG